MTGTPLAPIRAFLREAKRRRIYTSAVAYLAVAAGVIEVGGNILNAVLPPQYMWLQKLLVVLLLLGFPIVLVLAWIFDIGPAGITRTAAAAEGPALPARSTGGAPVAGRVRTAPKTIELVEEAPDPERVRRASIGFVRHELRTPVNAILGYTEMLLEDARDEGDDIAAADLERILHCGRDILTLIERSLDPERVSAEQGRDLGSYGKQVRADLRDPLGAITGYTELLIEISREDGNEPRARDLERVLAASRKLLELSSDIVAVATAAPETSGLARAASMAEGVLAKIRAMPAETASDREGSLLVVDDSAMNRDLLARQLARKGYVVATAEGGEQALRTLDEQPFDLVLLDVFMDGMDGIEVLRRMKSSERLCDIPVIMISALDEVDSIVRCLEIGAADFVSKPFHPTLLDARIQATLAATSARAAPREAGGEIERLVAGTFPAYLLQRLRAGTVQSLDSSTSAAVCFIDIDQAVAATDPRERAGRVETLIDAAYAVAGEHGATVLLHGIGLLVAAGFPDAVPGAAERVARTALAFAQHAQAHGLPCRSALHTGALHGAVIGRDRLAYSVWGDAVDLARRMALGAERGEIIVSSACYGLIKEEFALRNRGIIDVAGRGQMRAYSLEREGVRAGAP